MPSPFAHALLLAAAYLVGSLPFSYLIVKLRTGRDVRTLGSGNAGATNVTRAAGKAAGLLAALLDLGKGIAVVLLSRGLGAPPALVGGAAFAAVLGHCHPVFLRFRGGKGGATGAGALAVLALPAALASVLVLALVIAWKRWVSLGTVTAAATAPLFVLAFQRLGQLPEGEGLLPAAAAIAALVVARHHSNLKRLLAGTEPRLGPAKR